MWRLTADQYGRSIDALLGINSGVATRMKPLQPTSKLFSNEADLLGGSENAVSELFQIAGDLAGQAVAKPESLHSCLPAKLDDDACVKDFISGFGTRTYRRPLETDEVQDYLDYFKSEAGKTNRQDALRLVVRRFLVAPPFLFRTELGTGSSGNVKLTPYETASALSYFLLDGPPDAALLDAAKAGDLGNKSGIEKQVKRLLAGADTSSGLMKMLAEYLRTAGVSERLPATVTDRDKVATSMADEPLQFFRQVMWTGDHKLSTLLNPDYAVVDSTLAAHYGLSDKPSGWQKVSLGGRAGGLLAQAASLVARPTTTTRAIYIREKMLCLPHLTTPPGTETDLQKQQQKFESQQGKPLTQREVREMHMSQPSCSSCHSQLDPLGFPFDAYDRTGKLVDKVDGQPVVTAGEIKGTPNSDGKVKDAKELISKLAASADVQSCFAQYMAQYAYGRDLTDADACEVDALSKSFAASGGDVVKLVTDLLTSDNFVTRSPMVEN